MGTKRHDTELTVMRNLEGLWQLLKFLIFLFISFYICRKDLVSHLGYPKIFDRSKIFIFIGHGVLLHIISLLGDRHKATSATVQKLPGYETTCV